MQRLTGVVPGRTLKWIANGRMLHGIQLYVAHPYLLLYYFGNFLLPVLIPPGGR